MLFPLLGLILGFALGYRVGSGRWLPNINF